MDFSAETPLAAALEAVGLPVGLARRLELQGEPGRAGARLAVDEVGAACAGAALLAAARLRELRSGEWPAPTLDRGHLRAALVSERLFRVEGEPAGAGFAPLSRFWPAADGWVRTHANYPWHHRALLAGLGVADDESLAAAIAERPAAATEDAVFAAGGVAAALRSPGEWRAHPQGAAVAAEPLVERVQLGQAAPRGWLAGVGGPAAGVRVLDFTRVIAGPVCSRFLGALGADVLRIDSAALPDGEPGAAADTLLGKRSAFLDLGSAAGARRLDELLAAADVVLLGHRPGSLDLFGLGPDALAARAPGIVVMELAAWGHSGPWRGRRGFDSIVQAASGIAAIESRRDGEPGALPCQLLDHGTGYLAAAAVLAALAEQRERGGSHLRRLSLARTAHWLLAAGEWDPAAAERDDPAPPGWHVAGGAYAATVADDPTLTAVPPPGTLGAAALRWPGPATRYGTADPSWRDGTEPG